MVSKKSLTMTIVFIMAFSLSMFAGNVLASETGFTVPIFFDGKKVTGSIIDGHVMVPVEDMAEMLGYETTWDQVQQTVTLRLADRVTIRDVKEERTDEALNLTLSVQYPQIERLEDQEIQRNINDEIKQFVDAKVAEGLKEVKAAQPYPPDSPSFQNELYITYEVKMNQDGWLSFFIDDYRYLGGAHGMTIRTGFTYHLETGARYAFRDLFTDTAQATERIEQAIAAQIKEKEMTLLTPFETVGDNPDFYLSPEGLVIFFQLYEYTPYVAGFPEFVIPYSTLEDLLKPNIAQSLLA